MACAMAQYNDREPPCVFVRELPMRVRSNLSNVLDLRDSQRNWKALAAKMDLTVLEVEKYDLLYYQDRSPTQELLKDWGTQNKTVDELVILLDSIGNDSAIEAIFQKTEIGEDILPPVQVEIQPSLPDVPPSELNRPYHDVMRDRMVASYRPEAQAEVGGVGGRLHATALQSASTSSSSATASSTRPSHSHAQPSLPRTDGSEPAAAARSNQPADVRRRMEDMPAEELASSIWPPKQGSVRKALIKVENEAFYKAGLANLAYNELKNNTNQFSERLLSKGGNRLGSGGYGSVYFLEMTRHERKSEVACKRIHQAMTDENAISQFINELDILTKIQIGAVKNGAEAVLKNIVELKAFSVNGRCPCLIFEYVPGGSLLRAVQGVDKIHTFTCTDRHKVAAQMSEALVYLHVGQFGYPIIHGDVKSSNILLDEMFNAKLCDFGVARILPDDDSIENPERQVIGGTNVYMAPEALRGSVTVKADAYSFGIVLCELLTGLKVYDQNRAPGQEDLRSFMQEQRLSLERLVERAYVNVGDPWPEVLYMQMYKVACSCLESKYMHRSSLADVTDDLQRLAKPYVLRTL